MSKPASEAPWAAMIGLSRFRGVKIYGVLDVIFVAHMYLLALILAFAYVLLGTRQLFLISALGIDMIFIVICFWRNMKAAVIAASVIAYLLFSIFIFYFKIDVPASYAQVGSYVIMYSIGIYGVMAAQRPLSHILKLMFIASCLYAITFLYLRQSINVDAILHAKTTGQSDAVTGYMFTHEASTGGDIGFRIYVSDMNLAIGTFYALSQWKRTWRWYWAAAAIFFIYCSYISDFRFATATVFLLSVGLFAPVSHKMQIRVATVVMAGTMLLTLGSALLSFNYYDFVRHDVTGMIRAYEADVAITGFRDNPFLGFGLAGNAEDMYLVVGNFGFAPSDIGYLGMLCRFGLIGYVLLFCCNMIMLRFAETVCAKKAISEATKNCLVALTSYVILTQALSTYVLDGGGGLLFALAIAYWGQYGFGLRSSPSRRRLAGARSWAR